MWSPSTGWGDSKKVLEANNLKAMRLGPKEGIALINGTQLITSLGAEAVERATALAKQVSVKAVTFILNVYAIYMLLIKRIR